jgi:hypothetical protein
MRKILLSVALGTATVAGTVAIPAAAQAQRSWQHPNGPTRGQVNALLGDLSRAEQRINRSFQRRIISAREAAGLRREANGIRLQLNRAARNGIGGREFATLRFQVNRLEQRVRMERRDVDRRRG